MLHLAIVEDNHDIRAGLSLLLNHADGMNCAHTYQSAEEALEALPPLKIDVALIDIHLPGITGIALIALLKPLMPRTEFMICTVYEDDDHIFRAIQAGATSYMLKRTPAEQLVAAIREVSQGGSPMSGKIARKVVEAFMLASKPIEQKQSQHQEHWQKLTVREKELLEWLAKGYRYQEIADKLFISIDTVRAHIRNIYEKLQVNSKIEAINKVFGN
jgi:DNA-binding NarL/FixJ family response regulator